MYTRVLSFLLLLLVAPVLGADKPNFVWLLSEDNSKHYLKLFDENGAATPHIERLAASGLVFEHAFSNSPVCSVARTTLITGCYAPRIGTQYHRRSVLVPLPHGLRMFPAYLRDAGYFTSNNRKKDYNAIEGDGVWDESSGKASWRHRKPGQPFFHMQSFGATHESSLHFSTAVMENEKTKTDPQKVAIAPYHPDTETFRYTYARYHDRIRQVDAQIGRVVDQLEKDGLLEETFVFYFGDHGGVLPRGKGYVYESGLHVPLVVRVPKKWEHLVDAKRGTRVRGFVSFVDFGPTLLRLAGLTVPEQVDGRPFLGRGVSLSDVNARDEAFGYADRFDEKYDFVRSLRKGRYKYIRSYEPFNFDGLHNNYRYKMLAYAEWRDLYRAGQLAPEHRQFFERRAPEALYDLETDPYETKNLAGDPKHAASLQDVRDRLASRVRDMPDLSLFPENHLVETAFADPVAFGQARRSDAARLLEIADLSLLPFSEARAAIETALRSSKPWERYRALITCSAHGKAAAPLVPLAKELAKNDSVVLVRTRAAEFLGLIEADDPRPYVLDALRKASTEVEAALVLNTLVLLRDGRPGYDFNVTRDGVLDSKEQRGSVNRRMEYLLNE